MKDKSYTISVYDISGNFLRTIPPTALMSEIAFSSQINGGQGELVIRLSATFSSAILATSQIVRVYCVDSSHQDGRLIYSGVVGRITRCIHADGGEYIEARCLGLASIMSFVYAKSGGVDISNAAWSASGATFHKLWTIIGSLQTDYPGLFTYTVTDDGNITDISYSYEKVYDAINKTVSVMMIAGQLTNFFWYCGADGIIMVTQNYMMSGMTKIPPTGRVIQTPTIGRDVESMDVEESMEGIVNAYRVDGTGYTSWVFDSPSIVSNGRHENHESRTDLTSQLWLDVLANAKVTSGKNTIKRVTVVINSTYDIESILPGDLMTIQNIDYDITALQVQKVDYTPDRVTVQLELIQSFSREVLG